MNRHLATLSGVFLVMLVASACATRTAPSLASSMPAADPADFEMQLNEYVEVQEALAADDFDEARAQLEEFARITDSATQALAARALEAPDIATLRVDFKPLSESLVAQDLPQGFARAYCPMYDNGASWVQRDGPVRNPYYGSTMLTCGVVDAAAGAHMDHTAQHGGTVFMAPDGFHHIEGVYPEPGVFRIYATDNYRAEVDVTGWTGRAVTEEDYDETTDEFVEVAAIDLRSNPDGAYLEARVPDYGGTAEVIAKVVFQDGFPAERFDFIFASVSSVDADASEASGGVSFGGDAPDAVTLAQRILPDVPDSANEIAAEIAVRDKQIQDLIGRGAFTEIFIPALQAKELALALQQRGSELPMTASNQVRIAVRHLVRAAYLLDWYGDLGNKNDVDDAYGVFGASVSQIAAVYDVPALP
jgi:Cu(I)/Ag(I) efflux system membrane fusion protein